MQCGKPGGHQKVVIKVQCHLSHSGPGSPRNPHGNMGSRCNSDSRGYLTQKATESGYWYPKAHQSLARLLPRALTLQNFPPVLWVTKQARGKRNPPGKETQVLSVRSQAVCAKVAELGYQWGTESIFPAECVQRRKNEQEQQEKGVISGVELLSYFSYNMPCCTIRLSKKFMFPNKGYSTNTWPALLKPIKVVKARKVWETIKDKKSLRRYDSQP